MVREFHPNGVHWAVFFDQRRVHNFTFTLPPQTPPGDYLLRTEHLAIHVASNAGGAQWYMGCAKIRLRAATRLLSRVRPLNSGSVHRPRKWGAFQPELASY